jgi:hypothetical protein
MTMAMTGYSDDIVCQQIHRPPYLPVSPLLFPCLHLARAFELEGSCRPFPEACTSSLAPALEAGEDAEPWDWDCNPKSRSTNARQ